MIEPDDLAPRAEDARPVMGFRVGITGHRRLDAVVVPEIERAIGNLLADVERSLLDLASNRGARDLYAERAPVRRLISPLAEGADRLAARAAVDRGWRLSVPLPFLQDEYERDFPDSVAEFRSLLDPASVEGQVVELDGSRAEETEAYLQVGRFVIDHSDLVIAVWNGEKAAGEGGTGQIVDEALARAIPVVHISSLAPHPIQLLDGSEQPAAYDFAALDPHIRRLILPRWVKGARNHDRAAAVYLRGEKLRTTDTPPDFLYRGPFVAPDSWLAPVFPRLIRFLGGRQTSAEKVVVAPPPAGAHQPIMHMLFLHFQRADVLATRYSAIHRSGFVLIYLCGSLSLVAASMAQYFQAIDMPHWLIVAAIAIELAALLVILGVYLAERHFRWRERWLDYRLLAEIMREIDLMAQIGGAPLAGSLDRVSDIHPERGWVSWFVAAVGRSIGIVGGRYDVSYLKAVRDYAVHTRLADQIAYHDRTSKQNRSVNGILHRASQTLFACTLLAIAAELEWQSSNLAPFLAGVFPAITAASFGIRNQAEFEIVVHRSARLRERLRFERQRVQRLDIGRLTSARLVQAIRRAALVMQSDTVEWAAIFEVKESDVA
jgi:hypothetical protein